MAPLASPGRGPLYPHLAQSRANACGAALTGRAGAQCLAEHRGGESPGLLVREPAVVSMLTLVLCDLGQDPVCLWLPFPTWEQGS